MKPNGIKAIAVLIVYFVFNSIVCASVIYDNNVIDRNSSRASDADFTLFVADDFMLSAGANTVADVHWTGSYSSNDVPAADAFTIQIYSDASGKPGTLLETIDVGDADERIDTGQDIINDIYAYSVDITPVLLDADTVYWLSVFNDTAVTGGGYWSWVMDSGDGNSAGRPSSTGQWEAYGDRMDFQLTGIPEPTTLALMGLGLAGIGYKRRVVKKAV